ESRAARVNAAGDDSLLLDAVEDFPGVSRTRENRDRREACQHHGPSQCGVHVSSSSIFLWNGYGCGVARCDSTISDISRAITSAFGVSRITVAASASMTASAPTAELGITGCWLGARSDTFATAASGASAASVIAITSAPRSRANCARRTVSLE